MATIPTPPQPAPPGPEPAPIPPHDPIPNPQPQPPPGKPVWDRGVGGTESWIGWIPYACLLKPHLSRAAASI